MPMVDYEFSALGVDETLYKTVEIEKVIASVQSHFSASVE